MENPRMDWTLLFNIKLVCLDKKDGKGGFKRGEKLLTWNNEKCYYNIISWNTNHWNSIEYLFDFQKNAIH